MILTVFFIILIFLYSLFLFWCRYIWEKTEDKSSYKLNRTDLAVTVIVPVRNESQNLPQLIEALIKQDYPIENFKIIIADDHSTDYSLETARKIFSESGFHNFLCISSPGHSKKDAITYAVRSAGDGLIITTDADTVMGKEWISSMVRAYVDSGSMMVCGPVQLMSGGSFIGQLQSIEFVGLTGIASAGIRANRPMFCNGANLAFSKSIFAELNGYENSLSVSGDDTQFMLKINEKYPGKISFLKDNRAIVRTNVINVNADLWQQRRRWASKIPLTLSAFTVSIAILAWMVHAILLIQLFVWLSHPRLFLVLLLWMMKINAEVALLKSAGRFFDAKIPLWIVIFAQPFYCLYIAGVGIIAPMGKFKWKERLVK